MSGTVVASVVGGIGNQMFCWATSYAAARRSGSGLILECGSYRQDKFGRRYLLPALGIADAAESSYTPIEATVIPVLARVARHRQGYFSLAGYQVYTDRGGGLNLKLLDAPLSGRCYLRGLWQSSQYFADYSKEIRKAVRLEPCNSFSIALNAVCVHIRCYNEDPSSRRVRLAQEYYKTAYRRCNERLDRPIYVVYSDDLDTARDRDLLPEQYEIGQLAHSGSCQNHDLCEMVAMSRFHNFIIANSTFSWWAAYLNNSCPWVQAPGRYRRSWYCKEPLPAEWDEL